MWVTRARQHEHTVANRADRTVERPERRDAFLKQRAPEVLTHALRVAAGQEQPVERSRFDRVPCDRRPELRRLRQLAIELDRLRLRAGLAADGCLEQAPGAL